MSRYAIGLGSNLGDRLAHLQAAVDSLAELGRVDSVSSLYETDPVGGPSQDPFLNAVVVVDSNLSPPELLTQLHTIEQDRGRRRSEHWGPRTLDLDIVCWDGPQWSSPGLDVPHVGAGGRRFVLEPLCEIWPEAPVAGEVSAAEAIVEVPAGGVDRLAKTWAVAGSGHQGRFWVAGQLLWFLAIAVALAYDGSLPGEDPDPSRLLGGLAIAIGGVLAYTSMRRLGRSLTALPEPVPHGELIERGSYRRARHPIYGGVFLLIAGTSMVLDSVLGVALSIGLLGFFWLKSGYEERQLRIKYPGYSAYRQRVRRRFIPFVI